MSERRYHSGRKSLGRREVMLAGMSAWLTGLSVPSEVAAHPPRAHGFDMTPFNEGLSAPDFVLPALGGGQQRLRDFRGQCVLLNFWATWCPPCLAEMPSMEATYQALADQGFTVLAVASDAEGAAIVAPFVERLGISFPVLLDGASKVSRQYGARNLPSSFVVNRAGNVVAAAVGEREWHSAPALSYLREVLTSG